MKMGFLIFLGLLPLTAHAASPSACDKFAPCGVYSEADANGSETLIIKGVDDHTLNLAVDDTQGSHSQHYAYNMVFNADGSYILYLESGRKCGYGKCENSVCTYAFEGLAGAGILTFKGDQAFRSQVNQDANGKSSFVEVPPMKKQ